MFKAERQDCKTAQLTNVQAVVRLRELNKSKTKAAAAEKSAVEQFVLAAQVLPRRCGSRLQRSLCQDPRARRDAEEAEVAPWVETMASLLLCTRAYWQTVVEQPGSQRLFGSGTGASKFGRGVRR